MSSALVVEANSLLGTLRVRIGLKVWTVRFIIVVVVVVVVVGFRLRHSTMVCAAITRTNLISVAKVWSGSSMYSR